MADEYFPDHVEHNRILNMQIAWCKEQLKELRPWLKENPYICIYCGNDATCKDHLLPLLWTGRDYRRLTPTVPACNECNVLLSDKVIPTIMDRAQYLAEKYRLRYKKLLAMPEWTDKDLEELGYHLQSNIRAAEYKRRRIEFKLRVLDYGGASVFPGSLRGEPT